MKVATMRNVIVGTAGHIDHGKTALVRALTGVDTDRLEEEKRRGISIDLGFAHLQLSENIRLGFVDVPGHERFVKNMLAGVGGIDLVLFIIAADESIKPQTREHFDICRLLRIPKGIVVLTKADLVDPDILGLVRLEAEEFVRGSFLEGAPIVAVSAIKGDGLDELKRELSTLAGAVAQKDSNRWFRMPVDRAFSMRGFGTVVTGTLVSGAVSVEDEVEVYPGGRRVRVRGIQVHGEAVKKALAGQRTALNLAGVEVADLARGMTLSEPGRFRVTTQVDTKLEMLAGVPPVKHGAPVHFHAGTAEIEAQARLLGDDYVRFVLREPLLMLPGDRFIIRKFSPVITIGGGEVLDINVPGRMRRATAAARLRDLPKDRIGTLVRESAHGLSAAAQIARTGLTTRDIEDESKSPEFFVIREPQLWFVSRKWTEETARKLHGALQAFHKQNPLAPGMPKEELRSGVLPGAPAFLFDAILGGVKTVAAEGELLRLAAHKVAFKEDEEAALAKIEGAFAGTGLAVPAMTEVLAKSGVEPARARSLLQILLKNRKLIKIGDELVFHHTALSALRELLVPRKGQRFSVPEFKDWTGISRKYAIPLLEFLDRERVTRREGDSRIVL